MADARSAREAVVWENLRELILDRYDYRRKVADALGVSFFRAKALRILTAGELSMRELATALSTDAPYTTLLVDELEKRGMVRRRPHADDRRVKIVSITPAGTKAARRAMDILLTPPPPIRALNDADFDALERIVAQLMVGDDVGRAS